MILLVSGYEKIGNHISQIINLRKNTLIYLVIIGFLSSFLISIPLKIVIARIQNPQPQAILILGGSVNRERFTAQFSYLYPNLPIWVSSGENDLLARKIFLDNGINLNRVYFDRRATDTVTNFTSLVDDFKKYQIEHLFVVTSDYHLSRASAIATIVLGSQGITFTPVSVPDTNSTESSWKIARDILRALIWLLTGHTGASLKAQTTNQI